MKEGRKIPSCVHKTERGTHSGEGKFTYHKECLFLFTAAKMDSFFPLRSLSTLRQKGMESV